jgi:hypothetical protein
MALYRITRRGYDARILPQQRNSPRWYRIKKDFGLTHSEVAALQKRFCFQAVAPMPPLKAKQRTLYKVHPDNYLQLDIISDDNRSFSATIFGNCLLFDPQADNMEIFLSAAVTVQLKLRPFGRPLLSREEAGMSTRPQLLRFSPVLASFSCCRRNKPCKTSPFRGEKRLSVFCDKRDFETLVYAKYYGVYQKKQKVLAPIQEEEEGFEQEEDEEDSTKEPETSFRLDNTSTTSFLVSYGEGTLERKIRIVPTQQYNLSDHHAVIGQNALNILGLYIQNEDRRIRPN